MSANAHFSLQFLFYQKTLVIKAGMKQTIYFDSRHHQFSKHLDHSKPPRSADQNFEQRKVITRHHAPHKTEKGIHKSKDVISPDRKICSLRNAKRMRVYPKEKFQMSKNCISGKE